MSRGLFGEEVRGKGWGELGGGRGEGGVLWVEEGVGEGFWRMVRNAAEEREIGDERGGEGDEKGFYGMRLWEGVGWEML